MEVQGGPHSGPVPKVLFPSSTSTPFVSIKSLGSGSEHVPRPRQTVATPVSSERYPYFGGMWDVARGMEVQDPPTLILRVHSPFPSSTPFLSIRSLGSGSEHAFGSRNAAIGLQWLEDQKYPRS